MGFYDNEIKRLCTNSPRLLIMAVNSVFNKHHSLSAEVIYLDKELNETDNPSFMDMLFQIESSIYHMEFQLLEENMAIRMYEYGTKATIVQIHRNISGDSDFIEIVDEYEINITMPEQTVIFLAGNNAKNQIRINLTLPDRNKVSYKLPCISASQTVEELCAKQLYLLIPFQQVQLNSRMNRISRSGPKTKQKIAKQLYEYQKNVKIAIENLFEKKEISLNEYFNLLECFSNIQQYLLEKDKVVETEVVSMGDNNYVPWSDRLRAEGREAGLEAGHEAGLKEGRENGLREGHENGLKEGHEISEITLVCKKLSKNKTIAQIADELESDIEHISAICEAAKKFAPNYDVKAIYDALKQK